MSFDIQKAIDYRDLSGTVAKRLVDDIRAGRYDIQPKYDGCHARFVFANGECKVLSSLGNEVKSCEHIVQQLAYTVVTGVVHGEIWQPGRPFQEISGDFRRQSSSPSLCFVPFDLTATLTHDDRAYSVRAMGLNSIANLPSIIRVGTRMARYDHDLFEMARDQQALGGYDGLVLRHRDKPYKLGRCRDGEVIKIKPLVSMDLKVLEVFPEKGAKTGKNTCALGLQWQAGQSPAVQRVATGLTQAQVDAFVADPASIVGKIVEVEAMGYTSDGFLREPRFIRIRDDKEIPDV